jgi:sortase A
MPSARKVVGLLSAIAIAAGLAVAGYAFFEIREELPAQVASVENPISCSTSSLQATSTATPSQSEEPAPTASPIRVLYPEKPKLDDRIGTITLPTLDLSWAIFEGTEEEQLSKGVGHYLGSVLPGIRDNSILAGHRQSVFNRIGELRVNDLILIETSAGVFTYQVRDFRVVQRSDTKVIQPAPTAVLTLLTCYPFDSLVKTTKSFLVRADLIKSIYSDGSTVVLPKD